MPTWALSRESKVRRRKDGTFKAWPGGRPDKRNSSFRGIHLHINNDFKAQHHGRAPRVGDVVRHKNKNGSYHEQAEWYIKTPYGWRKSLTGKNKPSAAQVKNQIKRSRK
jgi:hypothetical protein